jgi:uncharacterized protein YjbI with pentapeptide repeats
MANEEHLHLLKQGIQGWNTWRKMHPEIRPDLSNCYLNGLDLRGALLNDGDCSYTDFNNANLSQADLKRANLIYTSFDYANLSEANLSQTMLIETSLNGADLSRANLSGADLTGSELCGTIFIDTNVNRADFSDCIMCQTVLGDVNLSTAGGLHSISHLGSSHLGVNTIIRSQGAIPDIFVRGTGAPKTIIDYMHALAAQPVEYSTCSIKYSFQDETFVEKLQADLQQLDVYCWLLPMYHTKNTQKDPLMKQVDALLCVYDKLLVVFSLHSISYPWIETAIRNVLEKEDRMERSMLIPCLLDSAVLKSGQDWIERLHRSHPMIDFTHWQQQTAYEEAFSQLIARIIH